MTLKQVCLSCGEWNTPGTSLRQDRKEHGLVLSLSLSIHACPCWIPHVRALTSYFLLSVRGLPVMCNKCLKKALLAPEREVTLVDIRAESRRSGPPHPTPQLQAVFLPGLPLSHCHWGRE